MIRVQIASDSQDLRQWKVSIGLLLESFDKQNKTGQRITELLTSVQNDTILDLYEDTDEIEELEVDNSYEESNLDQSQEQEQSFEFDMSVDANSKSTDQNTDAVSLESSH